VFVVNFEGIKGKQTTPYLDSFVVYIVANAIFIDI